jgi:DNA-binding IclR family transcriptional regulator
MNALTFALGNSDVQNSEVKRIQRKRPGYPIESVDNALALLEMLRDLGPLRLADAATELGVSRSTAHRLLAMLVYRGYADQDASHRYVAGPALGVAPSSEIWTATLRKIAQPHLEVLADLTGQTTNLMVRAGAWVRFLSTVEGRDPLRIGDRRGVVLPVEAASAGKAILAELPWAEVQQILEYDDAARESAFTSEHFTALERELATVRKRGFAANFEGTEDGLSALGVAVRDAGGKVVGGLSVAAHVSKFRELFESDLTSKVFAARDRLEAELPDFSA